MSIKESTILIQAANKSIKKQRSKEKIDIEELFLDLRDAVVEHNKNCDAGKCINSQNSSTNLRTLTKADKIRIPSIIPPYIVGHVILETKTVRMLKCDNTDAKKALGIYCDEGDKRGLYTLDDSDIKKIIYEIEPALSSSAVDTVIKYLEANAEDAFYTNDKDLIPLENCIFNYKDKKTIEYNSSYVFTSKAGVAFNPKAKNVMIKMPDGSVWDVVSWIKELNDNPDVQTLLWEIIGAALRPFVNWDVMIIPYNTIGCNGKSVFCSLIENLVQNTTNLSIAQFQDSAMLESLITASCVVCHENEVRSFTKNAEAIKSCITHNKISINRKYQKPISFVFHGLIIESCNGLPKFQDVTKSWYRRLRPVLFDKCFLGKEKPEIIQYVSDKKVLEYVVYHVLVEMPSYYKLSNPVSSQELLNEYMTYNDPTRQFVEDVVNRIKYNFVSWELLYDLYKGWVKSKNPSGSILSDRNFQESIRGIVINTDNSEWKLEKARYGVEYDNTYDPMIDEYGIDEKWSTISVKVRMNNFSYGYQSNPKFRRPTTNQVRGIKRISCVGAITGSTED